MSGRIRYRYMQTGILSGEREFLMGKIVHTKGGIGGRGVAQGAICRICPGGCKTDCLRAGLTARPSEIKDGFDFADYFKEVDEYWEDFIEYDPIDDL